MTKYLVLDAGAVISLTMNGLLPVLGKLKEKFNVEFIITPQVRYELVDRPLKIKKYELEGVRVRDLIEKGVLTMSNKVINDSKLGRETKNILRDVNSSFVAEDHRKNMKLIHEGEASCLALARLCGCENVIVIDERTTRMLTEAPEKLRNMMEKKFHTRINVDKSKINKLKGFRFIRSSELLFIAYKNNLFDMKKDKILLDALLYGVKFKGTAISSREIEEMKRLV